MKKLLPLFCIAVLFFSCKTTGTVAEDAQEDAVIAAVEEAEEQNAEEQEETLPEQEEEPAEEELPQERIPQNEIDELETLFDSDNLQEEKIEADIETDADADTVAGTEVRVQETGDRSLEESGNSNRSQATEAPVVSVAPSAAKPAQSITPSNVAGQGTTTAPATKPAQSTPATKPASTSAPATPSENKSASAASNDSSIASAYDFTGDDDSETESDSEEEAASEPVVPSRTMTVKNNQFVDVVYPGTGWIYLGEVERGDHFIFQGRRLGKNETTFSLRSKKPGSATLHFYKNDALTGNFLDDYILINVGEQSATDAAHVKAPAYAEVVPPRYDPNNSLAQKEAQRKAEEKAAEQQRAAQEKEAAAQQSAAVSKTPSVPAQEQPVKENTPAENVQTVIQTSGGTDKNEGGKKTSVAGAPSNNASPSTKEGDKNPPAQQADKGNSALSLLEQAQKAYDEKRYAEALDLIQQFFEVATKDFDAGLYLQGRILEAKSEVQNIKASIDAYDTLIKNWPQSRFWRRASERSIYLKRFYIDIR